MASATDVRDQVAKLGVNMDRFNRILNGPDDQDVETDSGSVPTVAKVLKNMGGSSGGGADGGGQIDPSSDTGSGNGGQISE